MLRNILAKDFEVTNDGDLVIENGDFQIHTSNDEHIKAILLSYLGEWKQYVEVGIGIEQYQNGQIPFNLQPIIEDQLTTDNYILDSVDVENSLLKSNIYIKARRSR